MTESERTILQMLIIELDHVRPLLKDNTKALVKVDNILRDMQKWRDIQNTRLSVVAPVIPFKKDTK